MITFFLIFSGLILSLSAQETNSSIEIFEIDEYQSDIYYGNGIMTTKAEANKALYDTLIPAIKYEIYNGNATKMNTYHNFDVAYNYSAKEDFNNTAIAMALDLMEAYDQMGSTSWGWLAAQRLLDWVRGPVNFLSNASNKMVSKSLRSYGFSSMAADFLAGKVVDSGFEVVGDIAKAMADYDIDEKHDLNLEEMVDSYKKSIRSGHAVIMVTHSQGNLFAVEAADEIVGTTELGGDAWMKKFLYHVSIASPATRFARSNYHWLISLDNDPVAHNPGSVGPNTPNYARYFTHKASISPSTNTPTQIGWMSMPPADPSSPAGYWMRGRIPQSYTATQSYYDPDLQISQEYRFEVEADEWEYAQTNFHAFDFYMGKTVYPLYDTPQIVWTPIKNELTDEYNSDTHRHIVGVIGDAIEKHRRMESQWEPKSLGCTCKTKYAKMTHIYDPGSMNKHMSNEKVKDFAEGSAGKIYRADAGDHSEYVRAIDGERSQDGVFTIEPIEDEGSCYVLKDDASVEVGKLEGVTEPLPEPKPGAVQVTLTWENPSIDFDLNVGWDAGEHDIQNTGCPMEHFYVASQYDIYPGTYPIYVNYNKEEDNESTLIPEKMQMIIQVPGKTEVYDIDINTTEELEVGHVADIFVKYKDNKIVPDISPDPVLTPVISIPTSGGGSGGGGGFTGDGGSSGSHGESHWVPVADTCNQSCGCIPCEYKIIPYLEQLLYGPLIDADFELYEAVDYKNKTPLYTGKTTSGNTLYTAGNIEVPDEVVNALVDDTLYLLVAKGGLDIDHNDDFTIDAMPTVNQGETHLLLTGKDIKEIGFKANVLTEIAYQIVKDRIDTNSTQEVQNILNDVAKRVLNDKVYGDSSGGINYQDLSFWLPTLHKPLLSVDYNERVAPLVENLFANRDIYQEAYDIVYNIQGSVPVLQSERFDIDENISIGSIVGDITVLNQGGSSINAFVLEGEGNENFDIDVNGEIVVSQDAHLDYETKTYYQLYATATTDDGSSKKVLIVIQLNNISDAPEFKSYTLFELYENTPVATEVLKLKFDPGNSALQSVQLTGDGNEYFKAEVTGNSVSVKVAKTLLGYISKRAYELQLQVSNITQSSRNIPFTLIVTDRRDVPRLGYAWNLRVDENATVGTVVGKVNILSDGYSPIEYFKIAVRDDRQNNLYEWPNGYFSMDKNGTIRVDTNASLDYEKQRDYSAYVVAVNAMGESQKGFVRVNLNNIPDTPPHFHDTSSLEITVNKETNIGTTIGTIYYHGGDSEPTSIRLESGTSFDIELDKTPHGYFGHDGNAKIKILQTLKNTDIFEYNLTAIVTNISGDSNKKPIHIMINQESYEFSVLEGTYGTAIGEIDFGIEEVKNIITPRDNTYNMAAYFTLDNNGTFTTSWKKELNYKEKSQHSFTVTVEYENGTSKDIGITVNVLSRIIATLDTLGVVKKVILNQAKDRAYIADYDRGMHIVDISDVSSPTIISSLDTNGAANDLVLSKDEKYLYLLDVGKGLKVIDISEESSPQVVSEVGLSGYSYNIALSPDGNLAFVSHGKYGIKVIDIVDPGSPEIIQNIGFLGTIEKNEDGSDIQPLGYSYVVSNGDRLYSVDWNYGLQVININDLENPVSVYAESSGRYGHNAKQVYLHQEQKLIFVTSRSGMLYSIKDSGKIEKVKQDYSYDKIELLDNDIAYSAGYAMIGFDAYNPTNMIRLFYLDMGLSYGMVLDKERNIAYVANGQNGLALINLTDIEQPVHHEPVLAGTTFNIAEQNISSITVDDLLGNVSILKAGDTPILRMWTEQSTYTSGGLDCGYTYYALPIDKRCEYDYSYFNTDEMGNIYINDISSLSYENIGNMVPFSVYAENEKGHKSNQAKVMINIQEEPEYTLKFQRSVIKVDQNISVNTPIANVIYKESQRELFLLDVYETDAYYCNKNSVEEGLRYNDNYNKSTAQIIENYCTESTQFSVDSEGNLYVNGTLEPGIYTIHVIAADRFGARWLENQEIEIIE